MARKIKSTSADTRTARLKLKPRSKPYIACRITSGAHLIYRRLKNRDGSWTVRTYSPNTPSSPYKFSILGVADDYSDANGNTVLSCDQAVEAARERLKVVTEKAAPFSVLDAVSLYLKDLEDAGEHSPAALADIRCKLETTVIPALGQFPVAELTTDQLTDWRQALVTAPAISRGGHARPVVDHEDAKRRRRATATRLWNAFKAVLNHAVYRKKVAGNAEWKAVKAFKNVNKPRDRHLTIAECQRLINGADAEFRPMVQAGLLTGARYGGLARLRVKNFDPDAGTVQLQSRKGSAGLRTYYTHLTPEGVAFFKTACAGRHIDDLIFTRNDGSTWEKSNQQRFMAEACKHAGIHPAVGFHTIKHTYCSLSIMAGMSFADLAANVATAVATVEKNYAHLAPSHRAKQIAQFAPTFGLDTGKVAVLP